MVRADHGLAEARHLVIEFLALGIVAEIVLFALFRLDTLPGFRLGRRAPVLGNSVEVHFEVLGHILAEEDRVIVLNVAVVLRRFVLAVLVDAPAKSFVFIVLVVQHEENAEIGCVVRNLAQLLEIQEAFGILLVVRPVGKQLENVQEHVEADEASDYHRYEAADRRVMRLAGSIEVQVYRVAEKVLVADPVLYASHQGLSELHFKQDCYHFLIINTK